VDLREKDTWSFGHPVLMAHKSTTAHLSTITDGVHCPPKRLWLHVLLTPFSSTLLDLRKKKKKKKEKKYNIK
jgi:hypothetical protein